ncbi:DHA2 family multidrug resistance protein-like MFS transporter [Acidocella aromatica]|uniref:DHA2 family multidrug resistance protein-like MFS transporter n=2 Tax=Acidocella aromatica TaxID=1303579 RepID=A0A840VM33_9PROT|nr:DHA2 family multidrug resistance protein-like MFS transporter [Acidocella aromatica]
MSATIIEGLPKGARQRAMFGLALAVLLSVLDYTVVNVALPRIAVSLNCPDSAAIWVVNAYQLITVIALLPVAALGDRLGHARLCRVGLVLFVVASVFCAVAPSLPVLAAARALQGLGAACILGVNAALLRYIYPPHILGRGIALNGLVIGLGVAIGPTIAAAVLAVATWPWLFLINLPLGGAAFYFALTALPNTPRIPGGFDYASAALLALAFGGLIIGGDRFAHESSLGITLGLIALGAVSLVVLVLRQLGKSDPLLPVDLLARGGFRAAFLTGFFAFIASNFFIIPMPFALMNELHRGPVATGLLITPWPLAIVAVAPVVGRLTDRYPAVILSTIGLAITGTGFLLLRLMPTDPSNFDIAWRIFMAGAGFGLFQPPNNKAMIGTAPKHRIGGASGMVSVARLLGQTVGGMLVALTLGLVRDAPYAACLGFAAGTAYLAASISLGRVLVRGG